jgi:hypothetical protein
MPLSSEFEEPMPEFLYPGVYLEEGAPPEPIEGVPTSTERTRLQTLADELRRAVRVHTPEWTGSNESDPGITLAELLAFLADEVLPGVGSKSCGSPPKRPIYFSGRLLDAATLTAEQEYHREKIRRHNRAMVGYGVVTGLHVRVEPPAGGAGPQIVVGAGYAVDRRGEEICLPCEAKILQPANGAAAFVTIRFWEHPVSPSPVAGQPPADGAETTASEMEEACVIGIASQVLSPAIALARLVRTGAGPWELDPGFTPPRAGSTLQARF